MRYTLTLFIIVILFSCKQEPVLPSYSDDQLINILTDVQIANTAVLNSSKKIQDSLKEVYRLQISEIHDIAPDELDSIIQKVHLDLPRYVILVDSVQKRVTRLIDENGSKKKKSTKNSNQKK